MVTKLVAFNTAGGIHGYEGYKRAGEEEEEDEEEETPVEEKPKKKGTNKNLEKALINEAVKHAAESGHGCDHGHGP